MINSNLLSKIMGITRLLISAIVFLNVLTSCSTVKENPSKAEEAINKVVEEQNQTAVSVPEEVSQSLLESSYQSGVKPKVQARFDVSVNLVPARTFFVSLVADAGVNVVAHPEIQGQISLELRNVTVEEVLSVTREVYGYEYKFANNIYTIYPRKLRTEIFPINYIDVQRVGVTDTGVQIGKISSSSGQGSSGSRNRGSGSSGSSEDGANLLGYLDNGEQSSSGGQDITPGARVQTLTKTDFWYGLQEALTAIVGEGTDRIVMTNAQAGLVIVKAYPRELAAVRDFLEKSELSVQRQVVLETKILEVRLNDGYQAGINWGAISGSIGSQQVLTQSYTTLSSAVTQRDDLVSTVLNVTDITKLIQLLDEQGQVQVLSSPRISTVNNQKAVIRVGSDEFFVTGISNSTTSSGGNVTNAPEVELDSFFSGIALDVTPQISDGGEVILHVHPMVTEVKDQIKELNVAGLDFTLPLALRDVRESDSIVKAKSGQVVVLGGLMQESTSNVDTKRGVLGDIPVLNLLFKAKQKTKAKTELVILMQPIVVEEDTWRNQLNHHAQGIHQISEEYRSQ